MDATLDVGLGIDSQIARGRLWEALGAAVTGEVSLVENFDEGMLAMALDRTGVADASRLVRIVGICTRGLAGEAGEDGLSQGTKGLSAVLYAL